MAGSVLTNIMSYLTCLGMRKSTCAKRLLDSLIASYVQRLIIGDFNANLCRTLDSENAVSSWLLQHCK